MATDELTERIKAGLARAHEKLEVAKHVLAAGYSADAVSPAYYAVFHAAEAVLLVEGDEPRSHEGLKSLFGLRFVKTGRLPEEMASILCELKDERESSDYSIFPRKENARWPRPRVSSSLSKSFSMLRGSLSAIDEHSGRRVLIRPGEPSRYSRRPPPFRQARPPE